MVLAALAATSITAAGPGLARADCASPAIATSPLVGAGVPPDPTIYVFLPAPFASGSVAEVIHATADGQPVPARVDEVSRSEAYTVARVAVETGKAHRRLTIHYGPAWEGREISFAIDRRWRAPARRPVELAGLERRRDQWSCSFTDAWFLQIATPADAYRVEWAASPTAWDRGVQASAVFPRSDMDFWHRPDQGAEPAAGPGSVGLGHLSCFDYTIPEAALGGPLHVKVTGLYADGSESPAWAAPRRLDDGAASPPEPGPSAAAPASAPAPAGLPSRPTTPEVPTAHRSTDSDTATALATALAGALCLAALAIALVSRARRRRRLSRSALPPR